MQNINPLALIVSEKKMFSYISLCKTVTLEAGPNLTPELPFDKLSRRHKLMLHVIHESSVHCGFREEGFLMFFPI